MIIKSICGCVAFETNPTPYPYTYPIRPRNAVQTIVDIYKHEASCKKTALALDKILIHQSLDGPYLGD